MGGKVLALTPQPRSVVGLEKPQETVFLPFFNPHSRTFSPIGVRETEERRERERKKKIDASGFSLICTSTRDQTCNLGMSLTAN